MRYRRFDITVIAYFICLMLVALIMVGHNEGKNFRRSIIGSVDFALKRTYSLATTSTNKPEPVPPFSLEPEQLRNLNYYDGDGNSRIFPSFVAASNLFLASEIVQIPSFQIICAVQMPDSSLHGIDGYGHCLEVSTQKFSRWHHR